jgi:hypothetical protein
MASNAMLSLMNGPECDRLRYSVLLSATLVTITGEYAVTLRDLSTGGAGIEARKPLPVGSDVILRRRATEFFGTIVWSEGARAGIAFDEPISATDLMAQLNAAGGPVTMPAQHVPVTFDPTRLGDTPEAGQHWRGPDRPAIA